MIRVKKIKKYPQKYNEKQVTSLVVVKTNNHDVNEIINEVHIKNKLEK